MMIKENQCYTLMQDTAATVKPNKVDTGPQEVAS